MQTLVQIKCIQCGSPYISYSDGSQILQGIVNNGSSLKCESCGTTFKYNDDQGYSPDLNPPSPQAGNTATIAGNNNKPAKVPLTQAELKRTSLIIAGVCAPFIGILFYNKAFFFAWFLLLFAAFMLFGGFGKAKK